MEVGKRPFFFATTVTVEDVFSVDRVTEAAFLDRHTYAVDVHFAGGRFADDWNLV